MKLFLITILAFTAALGLACNAGSAPANTDTENASTDNTNANEETETSAEKNIVETASGNDDFSTLVAAVKAADLVETLSGDGPFTVFAPTNDAFKKLPEGTLDTLLKPESKDALKGILTYHVVAGKLDAAAVQKAIKDGEGKATLKTVQGEEISAALDGEKVVITDAKGGKSTVTSADVMNSNGVIHVIDTVLMPSK